MEGGESPLDKATSASITEDRQRGASELLMTAGLVSIFEMGKEGEANPLPLFLLLVER